MREIRFITDSTSGLGKWFCDVPFESIPAGFIKQIVRDPVTTYERYRELCPYLNEMSNIWNSCLLSPEGDMIAFAYGFFDLLLSHIEIMRFSIRPKLFRIDGLFWKDAINACRMHAKMLGVQNIYWMSCNWKAILRKVPDEVKLKETRVMEVIRHV
jgi:hypothetical protein